MTRAYYVYIMASKRNGTLYIGVTNDLERRVTEHKRHKIPGFTDRYDIVKLVWYATTDNVESAIQREKQLKKWNRGWKINLIERQNQQWRDISEDW